MKCLNFHKKWRISLIKTFKNDLQAHKFCDGDINKFYLMLRKRVCPYEYMHFKASNLNGWSLSQKLPVNNFEWQNNISKFDEDFVISNSQNSDKGCILEVDVECSKELHDVHYDLPYLSERMKSNTKSFERSIKSWIGFQKTL